jgi:di/tricarboxylate transporter
VTDVVSTCTRTWRGAGVRRRVAAEMAADLRADLAAAAEDAIPAEQYVGSDPRAFALAWAAERGVIEPRARAASSALAALVGAREAVLDRTVEELGDRPSRSLWPTVSREALAIPPSLLLALYALGALFAYAGALAAVSGLLRWRLDPAVSGTVRSLAVWLPVGTAVAIGASVSFASMRHFSTDARVVAGDVVVATAGFAVSVIATRLRVIQRARQTQQRGTWTERSALVSRRRSEP